MGLYLMGLYRWKFVSNGMVWVSGFVSNGGSISDGFFHGGGGGDSCGRGGGDGWLKERDNEKEINTNRGERWERDWIRINLLGSYIILIS